MLDPMIRDVPLLEYHVPCLLRLFSSYRKDQVYAVHSRVQIQLLISCIR